MGNTIQKQRVGNWLPSNRRVIAEWINGLLEDQGIDTRAIQAKGVQALRSGLNEQNQEQHDAWKIQHKEVQDLKDLLDQDPQLHLLAQQMIDQAYEYDEKDPTGQPQIQDYDTMLKLIDIIIGTAPEYMSEDAEGSGLIGFPINAVLDWCMGTHAGYAFFLEKRVNECFNKILNKWCEFLSMEKSAYVLEDKIEEPGKEARDGWLCEEARKRLELEELFVCDPQAEHYGFKSWNDFFTRRFKAGMRPVEGADDDSVIVSACESAPYRISRDIQKDTKFWLKGQPYSIEYMLDHDECADQFIGGTVYQAFLSAMKYHRWHSPVSGEIVKAYNIPGTYYAEVNTYPYDDAGPNNSQGYITHVAARAVILIKSDNPDIGLMAFIAVGMAEVSSCVLGVKAGDRVKKGDEIGYFQFGGSTHCLIFRKDVNLEFVEAAKPASDFNDSGNIKVNSELAVVLKDK